ncbi:Methylisocitrate lyase [Vibrio cholerae]|nr:Methylisocitrate lyase [Vibrio cholerae]
MNKAAENVYRHLLEHGNQEALLDQMQTRKELYAYLHYHEYEDKLDQLFSQPS